MNTPETQLPASLGAAPCSGYTVEPRWWETTLEACPPGLFRFGDSWGFKTEYGDENGLEAYCVETGEYFWGGCNGDKQKRRKLIVTPSIICPNAPGERPEASK